MSAITRSRSRSNPVHWLGYGLVGIVVLFGVVSFFWTPYALSDMAGGRLEPPSPAPKSALPTSPSSWRSAADPSRRPG